MDVVLNGSDYGVGVCKLMSREGVLVPFPLKTVELVEKVGIINVNLVRIDTNDRAYIAMVKALSVAGKGKAQLGSLTILLVEFLDFPQILVILNGFVVRFVLSRQGCNFWPREFGKRAQKQTIKGQTGSIQSRRNDG